MGKLRSFGIELDSPQGVYYGGQTINGKLIVELDAEMQFKEIRLKFKGAADVLWTETVYIGTGNNRRIETVIYSAHESYFDQRVPVFGQGVGMGKNNRLPPGQHVFPFSYQLPPKLPSSFEGGFGVVRYSIKGTIDRPWKFNHDTKRPFTVVSVFNLNDYPDAVREVQNQKQKFICCLCCKSGPLSGMIRLDRSGFVPGERLNFTAEILNMSSRDCTPYVKLRMDTILHATSNTRTDSQEIGRQEHELILPGDSDVWSSQEIQIPPIPPSFLEGCSIIDINYYLELILEPSGPSNDLHVSVPVIIGTIPLISVARYYQSQHEVPAIHDAPPPTIPSAPSGLPSPCYSESVFGKTNIREEDDSDYTRGEMNYAPAYAYYDW